MRFIVVLYTDRVIIARSTEVDTIRKTVGVLRVSEPLSLVDAVKTASTMRRRIEFTKNTRELIDQLTGIGK